MKHAIRMAAILIASLTILSLAAVAQSSGTWTLMNSSPIVISAPGVALLPNGKILYANGDGTGKAVVFDPVANTWTKTGNMKVKRNGPFTATLLATGKVLIAGNMLYKGTGRGRYAIADNSAELYDPATGTFSAIASMPNAHGTFAAATVLNDGRVLVLGGLYYTFYRTTPQCTGATDVYDPVTSTWSAATPYTPICGHTATKLRDGRVLAAGGGPRNYQASEIYDPVANTWTSSGAMTQWHNYHGAAMLPDGKVLVADSTAEVYDPATGVWTLTNSPGYTASILFALPTGGVLLQGAGAGLIMGSLLYDEFSGAWLATGNTVIPRYGDTGIQLPNGKVVIVGGTGYNLTTGQYASMTPEIYTP